MQAVKRWDIFASVILCRSPIIAPLMSQTEARFHESQTATEIEKSILCDFELKTKKDETLLAKRAELEREGKDLSELEGEIAITNAMRIDEWRKQAATLEQTYNLSDRKAYEKKDLKNLSRELDRKLILAVQQRFGEKDYKSPWIVPQLRNDGMDTLYQTALKCISNISTSSAKFTISGTTPLAVYTHRYPSPIQKRLGVSGAKLFFYDAHLERSTSFDVNSDEVADYQWLTLEEFKSSVPGSKYRFAVHSALKE